MKTNLLSLVVMLTVSVYALGQSKGGGGGHSSGGGGHSMGSSAGSHTSGSGVSKTATSSAGGKSVASLGTSKGSKPSWNADKSGNSWKNNGNGHTVWKDGGYKWSKGNPYGAYGYPSNGGWKQCKWVWRKHRWMYGYSEDGWFYSCPIEQNYYTVMISKTGREGTWSGEQVFNDYAEAQAFASECNQNGSWTKIVTGSPAEEE